MLSPMVLMLDKLFRRRQVDHFDFKFNYELDLRECVHSFSLAINSLLWEKGLWFNCSAALLFRNSHSGANLPSDCANVRQKNWFLIGSV